MKTLVAYFSASGNTASLIEQSFPIRLLAYTERGHETYSCDYNPHFPAVITLIWYDWPEYTPPSY